MPVGIEINKNVNPGLRPADLKEGEMYQDSEGDWALVLAQDEGEAVCAVFDMDTHDPKWFRYPYRHGHDVTFTGPYEATVNIGLPKIIGPEAGS